MALFNLALFERTEYEEKLKKLLEEVARLTDEKGILLRRLEEYKKRDLVAEEVEALKKQNAILGEKAREHDRLVADLRRIRQTLKDSHQAELTNAEEVNTPLVDLVIWILRGKPGPHAAVTTKGDNV